MNLPTIFNGSPIIKLDQVSVRYRILRDRVPTFKEFALRWLRNQNQHIDFWALRDISFTVKTGEVIGIIGSNGAGKSTLLKVIANILKPVSGEIQTRGVVAPILSLGAGFDPEMTGRENIYLNGAMLGFSRKEMQKKLPGLLEFSGLKDFIDAPLRTYSSGMVSRLAFSIATNVKPDILLIDEVLSVGDIDFQQKCNARIASYRDNGTTTVIVSHSLSSIEKLCDRVIWLEYGTIRMVGKTLSVLDTYKKEKHHSLSVAIQSTDVP